MKKILLMLAVSISIMSFTSCQKEDMAKYKHEIPTNEDARLPILRVQTANVAFVGGSKITKVYSFRMVGQTEVLEDSTLVGCPNHLEVVLNQVYVFKYKNATGNLTPLWPNNGGGEISFKFLNNNGGLPFTTGIGDQFEQIGPKPGLLAETPCSNSEFTFRSIF